MQVSWTTNTQNHTISPGYCEEGMEKAYRSCFCQEVEFRCIRITRELFKNSHACLSFPAPHPWFYRVFPPVWTSLYTSFWEIQTQTPSHSWGSLTSRTKQWFQTFGWPPALTTACAHQPFFLGDDIKVEFPWKFSDPEKGYRWPVHSIIVFRRYSYIPCIFLYPIFLSKSQGEFLFPGETRSFPSRCGDSVSVPQTFIEGLLRHGHWARLSI